MPTPCDTPAELLSLRIQENICPGDKYYCQQCRKQIRPDHVIILLVDNHGHIKYRFCSRGCQQQHEYDFLTEHGFFSMEEDLKFVD